MYMYVVLLYKSVVKVFSIIVRMLSLSLPLPPSLPPSLEIPPSLPPSSLPEQRLHQAQQT